MAIFLFGFVIIVMSMLQNEYAAPTVHIQEAAGHKLADGGIYGHVRHPMYWVFCCSPPALHCGWAALRRRCLQQSLLLPQRFIASVEKLRCAKTCPAM